MELDTCYKKLCHKTPEHFKEHFNDAVTQAYEYTYIKSHFKWHKDMTSKMMLYCTHEYNIAAIVAFSYVVWKTFDGNINLHHLKDMHRHGKFDNIILPGESDITCRLMLSCMGIM